jgi:hypothetical protein
MRTSKIDGAIGKAIAVSIVASLVSGVAGSDCAPLPVVSQIRNVTLPNGAISRGIAWSLGTPAQELAFSPRWPISNLLVWGTDGLCDKPELSANVCITWRGGRYEPGSSESGQPLEENSIPFEPNSFTRKVLDFWSDTLTINKNMSISNFAIGMPNRDLSASGHQPLSGIGLGPNSAILGTLKSGGKIASRTWSMFYGWMGAEEETQRDGSFVLGGYDRAKTSGRAYPFDMADGCESRLVVTISDVTLNFPNGTNESLFDDAMTACITPHFPVLLSLEESQVIKMTTAMGATTSKSFGLLYEGERFKSASEAYAGDLTIRLDSGPSIRIPNHQLVQPERVIDKSTGKLSVNGEERVLAIKNFGKDKATMPSLGKQFLSAAYLMANLDAETFTLWEADATKKGDEEAELVAVDGEGNELTDFCSTALTSGPPQSSPTKSPTGGSSDSNEQDGEGGEEEQEKDRGGEEGGGKGLSAGAIAGISVGVAVLAVALAIIAFLFARRRRRQRHAAMTASFSAAAAPAAAQGYHADPTMVKAEMHANSLSSPSSPFGKSELSGSSSPQYLDGNPSFARPSPPHEMP